MDDMGARTRLILGQEGLDRLRDTRVVLAGCGAVGGYALEGMVRAGVGHIRVVDADVFSESNLNRQVLCTRDTVGRPKAEVACERARSINPDIDIEGLSLRVSEDTIPEILSGGFGYLVDAIDTVANKCQLLSAVAGTDLKVYSSMGAALRTDPGLVKVAPLMKTSVCPLAANVRRRMRGMDTSNITCVYSQEPQVATPDSRDENGKSVLGSMPTIPAIFGMTLANLVILDAVKRYRIPSRITPSPPYGRVAAVGCIGPT
jgi:tRNA A37 threonylcarbamoyladenosine dehydratase